MALRILTESLTIAFVFVVGWLLGSAFTSSAYQQVLKQFRAKDQSERKP